MTQRVLVVSSEFPPGPGGIGTHAHQVARGLAERGWRVTVLTPQDYVSRAEAERFNEAQPFEIERLAEASGTLRKTLGRWSTLSRVLRRCRPDVLLASGDRMVALASFAAAREGVPWVAVEHGRIPKTWERWLKKHALRRADAVVSVSRYTGARLEGMGARCRRHEVIPNGADPDVFRKLPSPEVEAYRETLAVPRSARILTTVGHVSERKGQDVAIRALKHLRGEGVDVHYLMAGLPSKRSSFQELAERLGVSDRVHFLGRVDSPALVRLLNASDLFVMTSRHDGDGQFEGYGIAVVEASLCGKPSVVAANSGLSEAIRDGETGIAVPESDDRATAAAILSLLRDDEKRGRMGERAHEVACSSQTWPTRIESYHRLLLEVSRGS